MKMERLIGILSILLQREKITAPELAEQFEVSRRTIQRDIESLCRAGIPIATTQGSGGGISIMEGYRVDRTVLTAPEMQAILAGLRSLDSVSGTRRYAQLMEKLSAGSGGLVSGGAHMLIDLSSWYKTSLPLATGGGARGRLFHRGARRPASLHRRLSRWKQRAQLGFDLWRQGRAAGASRIPRQTAATDRNTGPSL